MLFRSLSARRGGRGQCRGRRRLRLVRCFFGFYIPKWVADSGLAAEGPTDPVVDAPAQRAFDSDPYTFLSALLPPLQTTAPTYPDEDYPSSVSTPSPPLSTRVGRTSRQDSSESDAFSQYDWKRSGSISTVAMDTPPLTSTDAGVETDADRKSVV